MKQLVRIAVVEFGKSLIRSNSGIIKLMFSRKSKTLGHNKQRVLHPTRVFYFIEMTIQMTGNVVGKFFYTKLYKTN